MTYLDYILVGKGFLYPLRHKNPQRGGVANDDGQANIPVKVRRLPNNDFRFIRRLQLQRKTRGGQDNTKTERGMFYAKTIV